MIRFQGLIARAIFALLTLVFWADISSSWAGTAEGRGMWVSSIDRPSTTVRVLRGGTVMGLTPGAPLLPGDRVEGLARGLITLRTPDRGVVIIAPGTVVEIEQTETYPRAIRLKEGAIRGMFGQAPEASKGGKSARPIRFLIRSRTAVMGVRGTDFLIELPAEGSAEPGRILTLEGAVEAAPDVDTLVRGAGVPVAAGQKVEVNPQTGISAPTPIQEGDLKQTRLSQVLAQFSSAAESGPSKQKDLGPPEPSLEEALPSLRVDPADRLPRWSLLNFDLGLAGYRGIRVVPGSGAGQVAFLEGTAGAIIAGELSWSAAYRAWSDRLWIRAGFSLTQALSGTVKSLTDTYGPETILGSIVGVETRVFSRLSLRTGLLISFLNGFRSTEIAPGTGLDLGLIWRFRERGPGAPRSVLRGVWIGTRNFSMETSQVYYSGEVPMDPWMIRAGVELAFGSD